MPDPKMSPEAAMDFLQDLHVGVLAVQGLNGRPPMAIPIWYAYERGGDVTIFTGGSGKPNRKMILLEAAGKATFTVQQEAPPYKYVSIEGTVRKDTSPPREDFLRIIQRYIPGEAGERFFE